MLDIALMIFTPSDWYWFVGGDQQQVYSSKKAAMMPLSDADYIEFLGRGVATVIASQNELVDVLRANSVPPYHRVLKSTIISRLTDAQLVAATSAFNQAANIRLRERWYATDQPSVNADDPDTVAMLTSLGADPKVVLAP